MKYTAFMAPESRTELSVIRIDDLHEEEIWAIGDELVPHPGGTDRNYRADLTVSDVREILLDVVPEIAPHPKHANIVGLPTLREEQLEIAKQLRDMAKLKTRAS